MRLLIAVHDLSDSNRNLMPWRTVCEVAKGAKDAGHFVTILSLANAPASQLPGSWPADVIQVNKSKAFLARELETIFEKLAPDAVYWPVAWREPVWRIKVVGAFGIPVIGYFPGGSYKITTAFNAARRIGIKGAMPYLMEAFAPKKRQVKTLKAAGFSRVIAMTNFTARHVVDAGYDKTHVYANPPGKDNITCFENSGLPNAFDHWRQERPCFLFMGPPSMIRGVMEMLDAFDQAAEKHPNICLVCLFRPDSRLDSALIQDKIARLKHKHRIWPVWEMLDEPTRNGFLSNCFALVQPFVVVPSEIPLAIIENMAWGKPVIVTNSEGTGEFVKSFGLVVPPGRLKDLRDAILKLINDKAFYAEKVENARTLYEQHPNWADVAGQWIGVAESL